MFSTPTLLGRGTADASGTLIAAYPIPASVAPGVHTVQLNGIAPDGTVRSVEVKVEVVASSTDDTSGEEVDSPTPTGDSGSVPTGLILVAALAGLVLAAGTVLGLKRAKNRKD
jgi:hypothetical protein